MPLYEYACADCDHRFEVLQRLGEGSEGLACPKCDSAQVEKQFSTFASASTSASTRASTSASNGASTSLANAPAGACGGGSGFT